MAKKNQGNKIGFISLGCPKALVDSEKIITWLQAEGYETVGDYGDADLVIVNTCGFITDAEEESLEAIAEALSENGRVIVTGCLGAKKDANGKNFVKSCHPKVLSVSGPDSVQEVMEAVHKHLPKPHEPFIDLMPPVGMKLTPGHYAYLKISEGCGHQCSFCIIPSLRGPLVSYPIGQILDDAER
ncbi:MAG: 30S ribosomal protein S12 methylthiotransferase RimO, partial [Oxalobacter sp.]|nr:30S ribosomal protein S12 methylthiotransferase RimO [Oxalobacter sp.]